jgi:copper chaperone NosL
MIIVDFPGAKAQIHYTNKKYDTFCSTLDLFLFYLQPDRPGNIAAIYVNDMGKGPHPSSEPPRDTTKRGAVGEILSPPSSNWIDAEKAFYVYGGDIMGSMGEALVPFSDIMDAEVYMKKHGGRIIRFNDVTLQMLKPK